MSPTPNSNNKKAVALKYDQKLKEAPVVKAKGSGVIAEQMIDLAHSHQIPIQEDSALVEILGKLQLDQQIPSELYEVVAEILALVYKLERRAQNNEG
jgi:flagellar biosynthesis protein